MFVPNYRDFYFFSPSFLFAWAIRRILFGSLAVAIFESFTVEFQESVSLLIPVYLKNQCRGSN